MNKKIFLTSILICLVILLSSAFIVTGQENPKITVSNDQVTMDYPIYLYFKTHIDSNNDISDVRMKYSIEQESFASALNIINLVKNRSLTLSLSDKLIEGISIGEIKIQIFVRNLNL